jgi:hypothetical protein
MLTKDVLEWNQRLLQILEAKRAFDKSRNYFPWAKRENSSSTGSRLATATSLTELQVVKGRLSGYKRTDQPRTAYTHQYCWSVIIDV